jgi:glycosidase
MQTTFNSFSQTIRSTLLALAAMATAVSVSSSAQAATPDMQHVAWSHNAVIYQVNIRQYTPEGTFNALTKHIPTLKKMGVDVIWLMPIQPIGKINRKGTLGSYYSISDYTNTNPEFGSLSDLHNLVKTAHQQGIKVILDWVANHTAWDSAWAGQHKDWFKLNEQGAIYPVTFTPEGSTQSESWSDVIGLNYDNQAMRKAMFNAMAFWIKQTDIDGFRCDVAMLVPRDFWEDTRAKLDRIKPMFMLAEDDHAALHDKAFDMTYAWDFGNLMQSFGQHKVGVQAFREWITGPKVSYPKSAYRMLFTSNHDYNSWVGTDAELYGYGYEAMAVMTFTLPGMPLIYSGQEARLNKRLEFFEKDPIDWKTREMEPFYTQLIALKHDNPALANGQYGGDIRVLNSDNDNILAYQRTLGSNVVTVALNLSNQEQSYQLEGHEVRKLAAWRWQIDTRK